MKVNKCDRCGKEMKSLKGDYRGSHKKLIGYHGEVTRTRRYTNKGEEYAGRDKYIEYETCSVRCLLKLLRKKLDA